MYSLNIPESALEQTQKRIKQVFSFETPDRLPFVFGYNPGRKDMTDKFAIAEFAKDIYKNWKLEETEEDFDAQLRRQVDNMNKGYELFPYSDRCPRLNIPSFTEVTMLCLGTRYRINPDETLEVFWANELMITDIEKDLDKIRMLPDYREEGLVSRMLKKMKYFAEHTGHKIPIHPFDTQSPTGNLVKLMDSDQFFMEFYDRPEAMKAILLRIADCIIELLRAQEEAAGYGNLSAGMNIEKRGITISDDLVSVITPELFIEIAAEATAKIFKEHCNGTLHTCGPIWGSYLDAVLSVEGCNNLNDVFIKADKSRTAEDMLAIKKRMAGRMVFNSPLPLDLENFTVDFVKRLMDGGGVYLSDSGPIEEGLRIMDILDRASA